MSLRKFQNKDVRQISLSHVIKSFKHQPPEMIKHTQTIRWQQPTNCLNVFDDFVGLTVKGLKL